MSDYKFKKYCRERDFNKVKLSEVLGGDQASGKYKRNLYPKSDPENEKSSSRDDFDKPLDSFIPKDSIDIHDMEEDSNSRNSGRKSVNSKQSRQRNSKPNSGYGYGGNRNETFRNGNHTKHFLRKKYFIGNNRNDGQRKKKISARNKARIDNRTSTYRQMESDLKDTQNKLRKSEKEKKFYKGTLEMVEKAEKIKADKTIQNVTEAAPKEEKINLSTTQYGPPCVPPNVPNVLQMSTPVQSYTNHVPVSFPTNPQNFQNSNQNFNPNFIVPMQNQLMQQPVYGMSPLGQINAVNAINTNRHYADLYRQSLQQELARLNYQPNMFY